MIPQIDNSLSDVIKQNKIPNRTYKIVSDTELKTVLGEPTILTGSSIEIKDNAYSELDIPKVYGKSVQETRSGKNLLNINNTRLQNTKVTVDNNSLTVTADNSSIANARIPVSYKLNTKYILSFKAQFLEGQDITNPFLYFRKDTANKDRLVLIKDNLKNSYVAEITEFIEEGYELWIYMKTSADIEGTISILFENMQLEEGTVATEYEQYGASPSPEFPSEIQSVGDNVNLANIPDEYITKTKSIDITNLLEKGKTYSFSGFIDLTNSKTEAIGRIRLDLYVGDAITYKGSNNISPRNKGLCKIENITIGEDITKVLLTIQSMDVANFNCNYSQIKINKGTVATPYSEYGKGTVEIKQSGKNLFNKEKDFDYTNISKTEWTITQINNGLRLQADYSIGTPFVRYIITDLTKYAGKTIRVKADFKVTGNNTSRYLLGLCDYNGSNGVSKVYSDESGKEISFVFNNTEERKYLFINLYSNGTGGGTQSPTNYVDFTNIIITIDDEDITYEPYFANNYVIPTTPLRSLPNGVCDTIEEDGIHRRVGSIILDGSENWSTQQDKYHTENRMMFGAKIDILGKGVSKRKGLCNYFKHYNNTVQSSTVDITAFNFNDLPNTSDYVYFKIDRNLLETEDVAGWKKWLSEHTPEVIYNLSEEVIEPFEEFKNIQNIETLNKRIIYLDAISEVNPDIDAKYYSVENVSYEQEEVSRIMGFVDNLEAIKQSAYHILGVERYSSDIYDFNYGVELEQYIGQSLEYIEATIQDTLQEALTQDERILGVEVTEITQTSVDCVYIKFNLICYLDEIEMGVYINV